MNIIDNTIRLTTLLSTIALATATGCAGGDATLDDTFEDPTATCADSEPCEDGDGGAGGGNSGGSGGAGASQVDTQCATALLDGDLPIVHEGSTIDQPNLIESWTLEWADHGDDAVLFFAPEAGTYVVSYESLDTGAHCGVAIYQYDASGVVADEVFDRSVCPAEGEVLDVDAAYIAGDGYDGTVQLEEGQEVLMFVSCPYWNGNNGEDVEVDYRLTIDLATP